MIHHSICHVYLNKFNENIYSIVILVFFLLSLHFFCFPPGLSYPLPFQIQILNLLSNSMNHSLFLQNLPLLHFSIMLYNILTLISVDLSRIAFPAPTIFFCISSSPTFVANVFVES